MKQKISKKTFVSLPKNEVTTWLPHELVVVLLLIWILVVIKYYGLEKFAINISALDTLINGIFSFNFFHSYFLKVCFSIILAVWIFFASIGVGAYLLSFLKVLNEDKYGEKLVFSLGLGLCAISTITLFLGFIGFYYRWVFYAVLILLSLVAVQGWRMRKVILSFGKFSSNRISWLIVGFLLLVNSVGTFVPEVFYDSLNYHLAIPYQYIQSHRIPPMTNSFFSAFPMNMEMLYTFALLLSDEILSKMMHFITCIGIVIALLAFGRRYLTEKAGLLSSIFYLSMPMVAINTWTTAVETGLTFFQLLSFYVLLNALLCEETVQRKRWIVLSGIFTGFAMGIKYSAFTILPISLIVLIWYRFIKQKTNLKTIFNETVLYGTIAFVIVLPWLLKNYAYHKNPLYPFLGTNIGEPKITQQKWDGFKSDTCARNIATTLKNADSRKRLLLHPWILTMAGQSNADFIGPIFLVFLPLLILVKLKSSQMRVVRLIFIINWIVWFSTSETLRYFLSNLVFLAILLSGILESINIGNFFKRVFYFSCCFIAIAGSYWSLMIFQNQGGWLVLTGKMTKQDYLSSLWPSYPYPSYFAYDYMNKNLEKNAKILILGDARGYYLERNYVVSSVQDYQPLVKWAEESKDEDDLFNRFSKEGVTHIFLNYLEAKRTTSYNLFPWNERSWSIFEKFWEKHVELLWNKIDMQDKRNPHAFLIYTVKQKINTPVINVLREWEPVGLKGRKS